MTDRKKPQKFDVDETADHEPEQPPQTPPPPPGGGGSGEDGGYPDPKTPDPQNPPKE